MNQDYQPEERDVEKEQTEEQTEAPTEPGTVQDIAFYFLNLISVKGWQYMGLMVHPENGKILVDFNEAQKAIDLFSLIYDFLKDDLSSEVRRDLQSQLSNLQLNFVEKNKARKNKEEKS